MDIPNTEVKSTFSKELFKKGDPKSVWIEKYQLFEYSSSDEDVENINPD